MDSSDFGKDNFDPMEWINKAFESCEAKENREEHAAALVSNLQSLIQEISKSLAETAEQVVQNMPRIAREVETMKQEALLLQEQMNAVKDDVIKVERESSQTMSTLLEIDRVKSNMQEASKALREADNWSTLSADVDEVFESGDINAISTKLIGMQNSLEILVDVPDYKERSQRLEALKDRLEAIISPQLIAAFNSQANVVDVALVYMKIFKDIKRLHRLRKYYHNFQKKQLLQQWTQILEADSEETLTDWLNNFYDHLLSTWHSQMTVCNQLLLDIPAIEVLSELLVDTLSSLSPPLDLCIDNALKGQSDAIQYLIELKQITDRLAKSLDISIQAVDAEFLKNVHVVVLSEKIYEPYRPYVEKYASMEQSQLISSLDALKFQSDELSDYVHLLGDSVSKAFLFAQEADNRCHQLTNGCAYAALFQALKGFFEDYLGKFKNVQHQLKRAAQETPKALGSDWIPFQQSLQSMQIAGEVLLSIERLEQLLKSNLREISRKLSYFNNDFSTSDDSTQNIRNPFHAYDNALLSRGMQRELQNAVTSLQEDSNFHPLGDMVFLYQKICSDIGSVVIDSILCQVKYHLRQVPHMKVWSDDSTSVTNIPTFGISPQEYITEVGQFLMTIPQHIEPFILQDNPALYIAFMNFKSCPTQDSISNVGDILEHIANGISEAFLEVLLKVNYVVPSAVSQMTTDIDYFCDVLDDLGLVPHTDMQHFSALLKVKPDEFSKATEGKPLKLVRAVKAMRKIGTTK